MPIRAFVTQDLNQLTATIKLIEKAQATGQLQELQAAGVTTRSGKVDLTLAYQQARYEAYLRAQEVLRNDPNYVIGVPFECQAGLAATTIQTVNQWTNPYREINRRVDVRQFRVPSFSQSQLP